MELPICKMVSLHSNNSLDTWNADECESIWVQYQFLLIYETIKVYKNPNYVIQYNIYVHA